MHVTMTRDPRPKARNPFYASAGLALAAEALLLGGLWVWLARPAPVPPQQPLTIALAPPVEAPKPAPPAPKPVPKALQKPVEQPRRVLPRVARVTQQQPSAPQPETPRPPPAPQPSVVPAAATPAPRPAPQPPAPARPDASFESALRAAIQSALRYPESARMAGLDGRARVAFVYRDGSVSEVRLVASSGSGLLDRAALQAVRDAVCPPPPPGFAGKSLSEQLWVDFNLDNQS